MCALRPEVTIVVSLGLPTDPQVIQMLEESDAYYASLYPAESNHLLDIESLLAVDVWFFVACEGPRVRGFGALVAADGYGEVKRMYVDPGSRGLGIGRTLLERIERQARELDLAAMRLETGIRQPEAISLYRRSGFCEIGPFGDYRPDPLSLFMEKSLNKTEGQQK
jgi:putative acetyltransferase